MENNDDDLFSAVRAQMPTLIIALSRPGVRDRLVEMLRESGSTSRLMHVRQTHRALGEVLSNAEAPATTAAAPNDMHQRAEQIAAAYFGPAGSGEKAHLAAIMAVDVYETLVKAKA